MRTITALLAVLALAPPAMAQEAAWTRTPVDADQAIHDPLLRQGRQVFLEKCYVCHGPYPEHVKPSGIFHSQSRAGTFALEKKYGGELPAELEKRMDLSADFVAYVLRHGSASMPPFRPTELSNEEVKAVSAYLARRNAPSN